MKIRDLFRQFFPPSPQPAVEGFWEIHGLGEWARRVRQSERLGRPQDAAELIQYVPSEHVPALLERVKKLARDEEKNILQRSPEIADIYVAAMSAEEGKPWRNLESEQRYELLRNINDAARELTEAQWPGWVARQPAELLRVVGRKATNCLCD